MKNLSRPLKTPCLSTVHIVKASNKIFNTLENQAVSEMTHFRYTEMTVKVYDSVLKTIVSLLPIEELYTRSTFEWHEQVHENYSQLT